jgi:hypothetical protein
VTFSRLRVGLLCTTVFAPLSGGCFDGESGTNDAFAVQSCVADFLPGWAILFITVPDLLCKVASRIFCPIWAILFIAVPDFLYVNEIFFACFGGPFLTVK